MTPHDMAMAATWVLTIFAVWFTIAGIAVGGWIAVCAIYDWMHRRTLDDLERRARR